MSEIFISDRFRRLCGLLVVVAALMALSACSFPLVDPPPPSRNAALWPFASDSPWNMPVGSGARFASTADARTVDLLSDSVYINAASWSHPVYQASASDPIRQVTDPSGNSSYRIPASATPAAPSSGDMDMHVVDPTRHWVDESWKTTRNGPNWNSGYHVRNDLYGPGIGCGGVRAYGGSAIGGLIRTWELQAGGIRHALAFAVPGSRMQRGPTWPATSEDSGSATLYRGHLPMGTFVAIPASVDVNSLGLSAGGRAIARALQDYGAYLVDASSQFVLYAEPSAESLLGPARADLGAIRGQLRVVTNNSPGSVGGGGTPRVPFAPPLG